MSKFRIVASITIGLAILVHNTNVNGISTDVETSEIPSEGPDSLPLTGHYEVEEKILGKLKEKPFLSKIRPNGTTHVKVNIYVRDIQMKNSNKLNFDLYKPWTLDLTLRQYWNDPRLAYTVAGPSTDQHRYFPLNSPDSVWKPDLFFPEAYHGDFHIMTEPNRLLWLYPNGDLVYSMRISLSVQCRQSSVPRRFGHGIGTPVACPLRMASYGYTSDQLEFDWVEQDPIEVRESLYKQLDSNYCTLDKATANATSTVKTRTGTYSTLRTEFEFLC